MLNAFCLAAVKRRRGIKKLNGLEISGWTPKSDYANSAGAAFPPFRVEAIKPETCRSF